ncbi:hypothetical protein AMAG_18891 [Allomyces macrogynus ATCC 38327]|uniref:LysM domain-containing protein n=1 Tax=Allomyces macrogynus (strain ATCC 38327) TaxID=578462 RepID=A0A0L0SJB2_ALLM3|nr:hypothetical protein AMAG_18891 [Allomyces macrogynus ATCC 38327]|eukprot:KNE62586.1 hypothetical protein AMAG_18891 [Allomyces macrogynus ATCC 38327]
MTKLAPWLLHPVETSETLAGIALKYGVTTATLCKANRLTAHHAFFADQLLVVPLCAACPCPARNAPLASEQDGPAAPSPPAKCPRCGQFPATVLHPHDVLPAHRLARLLRMSSLVCDQNDAPAPAPPLLRTAPSVDRLLSAIDEEIAAAKGKWDSVTSLGNHCTTAPHEPACFPADGGGTVSPLVGLAASLDDLAWLWSLLKSSLGKTVPRAASAPSSEKAGARMSPEPVVRTAPIEMAELPLLRRHARVVRSASS